MAFEIKEFEHLGLFLLHDGSSVAFFDTSQQWPKSVFFFTKTVLFQNRIFGGLPMGCTLEKPHFSLAVSWGPPSSFSGSFGTSEKLLKLP